MKIGIIGAMEEEVNLLRNELTERTDTEIANYHFYEGYLGNVEVVILKSGIGKVNAAIGTTLLIDKFKPDVVINTGSAGGFKKGMKVGDVVVSTEVRHHDVDVTVFGYEYGQVPGMPAAYQADAHLMDVCKEVIESLHDVNVHTGLIVTGDSFINDSKRVADILGHFDGVAAVEMEAAPIAQTCYQFGVPFVVTRSISDSADEEANLSFDEFLETASINSAKMVMAVTKRLGQSE
ncbi:5'-methylthioadenosine/S-adenosylhomocysteine nucleosidase [Exiguobacterium sp. SL-10]|jgi:adenosylhomocysteine nucleosidase|uniref:5'-methylthioadenosine/S-adenosylhomocysteine nucleosidase n=1 Tax=unclassified Exiguobacterium TaxID=2644629 RepID=UPI00103F32AC|nr:MULTISPECIES: 5'-methylthioadenosine/S-adenosylhomocysteine nucleosidase [unclassified Exiguobacterium]TCI23383.1 5'-methylthioadenosine/S-adenosylhomocysteine nucleosidase [Exiguobacterium sp. SL-9]TCI31674.1 5'-methylthioadenosine/S-adenosylhomocysteine nucleosidase [Exiguobacterium sp. SL-10]